MSKLVLTIAASVLGLGITFAAATPLPSIDVPTLVEASTLIVVGRAEAVQLGQPGSSGSESFDISVAYLLKGSAAAAGRYVHVELDRVPLAGAVVTPHQFGIFFLRARPAGGYTAVDLLHPALAASPEAARKPAGDPLASVAHELTRMLIEPAAASSPYDDDDATAALRTIPQETTSAELRATAASAQMTARLRALDVLVTSSGPDDGEVFALRQVESLKATLMAPSPDLDDTVSAFATAIEGSFRSHAAVRVFSPLLRSTNAAMRHTAAATLNRIR